MVRNPRNHIETGKNDNRVNVSFIPFNGKEFQRVFTKGKLWI